MPSLGSIIIVFATIIQITRASSIIPSHSELINSKDPEFFGAPAKNPSSSIKRKRFSLRNILSKRADEKLGQMCGKNFYGNDRVKKQVENFCERTKKYTDNPQRGPPKLPVYVGKDKLFEKEGALYQIPVKKFMGLRIMWYLLHNPLSWEPLITYNIQGRQAKILTEITSWFELEIAVTLAQSGSRRAATSKSVP
ncbi:hypothetical protein GcM3_061028 [Golovinomyces cichoracearum]|uniref:Uncharacterized protein n=1 Tax=Golovinomyces cichoracearum TaxID=62708 RepID=A0A420IW26_9PEZI|nr:hypothetical protein GcM3_061028 [Golovinomyces cichoracearum]